MQEVEALPREKVLRYLEETSPALVVPYLVGLLKFHVFVKNNDPPM